ncbi:flagellar basal body rod protein FlgB [Paracraurococcus ruber]|uniref:Flagellar basal body rod protein FlgB n=1 Tax=Paracraurococcus ruber TaxID=77675 RepID=A0ABS1CZS4_9PROT|nr:flagellar biosynthesis protein FlgG [Paracraurococcus ruber]MBK1660038.1 flagellar biosynthesis protein FlgG [Paracraurococcus ruber]TDG28617.1 flagellar biosynthesis protein FlgG [Paracraurococcus ruber]
MLDGIDVFRVTGARMRYLAERQNLLAQNIANADTPHYQARDLKGFAFDSALLRAMPGAPLPQAATRAGHVTDAGPGAAPLRGRRASNGEDPDGNTVDLEEQMLKQADVARAYDLATTVYRRNVALLRTAAGGR